MRLAVIDIGTNSVRLDLYQVDEEAPESNPKLLHREKTMVRLGQGLFETGRLHPDAIKRTLAALTTFKHWCDDLRADKTVAYATSALRSAEDSSSFVNQVARECGIGVDIISGKEEARLILAGILQDRRTRYGNFAFIDIGGGSTEIGVCSAHELELLESFKLGAARLTQKYLRLDEFQDSDDTSQGVKSMKSNIRQILSKKAPPKKLKRKNDLACVLGSSGTIKAVKRLISDNYGAKHIKLPKLRKLIDKMSSLSPSEVIEMPGMNPRRADIILAGSVLLSEIMLHFEFNEVRFTPYAMRDGIMRQQLEDLNSKSSLAA